VAISSRGPVWAAVASALVAGAGPPRPSKKCGRLSAYFPAAFDADDGVDRPLAPGDLFEALAELGVAGDRLGGARLRCRLRRSSGGGVLVPQSTRTKDYHYSGINS
jgi:hypothetical protein